MSYSSRIPGNIATQRTGRNRYEEKGWRRFFLTDPRCRVQNDQGVTVSSSAAAPCSVDESTGNTVITFLSGHDGGSFFTLDGYVAGQALRTDEGEPLDLGMPFVLKTMIELVSISGDHGDSGTQTHPQISMGLIQETGDDFANDSARFLGSGVRINARSSIGEDVEEDARYLTEMLSSGGSGQSVSIGDSPDNKLFITEFVIGPDMATTEDNARLMRQGFQASGNSYAVNTNSLTEKGTNANQGFNSGSTVATLYAAIQDVESSSFSGATPCVLTVRFWYMVEADYHQGWGGSGTA